MQSLRSAVLTPLLATDAVQKAALALNLNLDLPIAAVAIIEAPAGIPGRPARPELVGHTQLKHHSLRLPEGRAALIHSIAHIELNAIELIYNQDHRFS
ncbi:MAG: DUF455 family protein [Burkholderiaceae bacterium]|nr:DUF455 family protein [Burkholderiaceae bacterium]